MTFFDREMHTAQLDSSPHPDEFQQNMSTFFLQKQLEKLALFLAQTWKDDHPEATVLQMQDCVLAVATELAIAATAVKGPIGLEILSGGGSAAACVVCKQVLAANSSDTSRSGTADPLQPAAHD